MLGEDEPQINSSDPSNVLEVSNKSIRSTQKAKKQRPPYLSRVPITVDENLVVLDRYRYNASAELKCAALEHDNVLVVDASAFGKHKQGWFGYVCYMLFDSLCNIRSVFASQPLHAIEQNHQC